MVNANTSQFVQWLPNKLKCTLTNPPRPSSQPPPTSLAHLFSHSPSSSSSSLSPSPSLSPVSAVYLGNTSGILDLFRPIASDFDYIFRRKAFLYHYTGMF